MSDVTVGVDVGTTSVKALAADADGRVIARARVPHRILTPRPDLLEHDVKEAWQEGPREAFAQVSAAALERGHHVRGVAVTSMVPSLTAVGPGAEPLLPGILYGDLRGEVEQSGMPSAVGFLEWAAREAPDAHGYWPCQGVATEALCGVPAIDGAVSIVFGDLCDHTGWKAEGLAKYGVTPEQMPTVIPMMGAPAGETPGGAVVSGATIDALCDQLVCDAAEPGDVLAIFGATLVVWIVTEEWVEYPGLVTVPHTVPGMILVGGPSNAGALFVDWARGLLAGARPPGPPASGSSHAGDGREGDPDRVPVWLPYVRGERVPFFDRSLRSSIHGLDLTQGSAQLERAAYEASGFVIRRMLERSGIEGRRIVASGGGSQLLAWMAGVADATGLPVDPVAVPEGAAYGAAYVGRVAAGLEANFDDARRWARCGTRIEPDPTWAAAAERRAKLFVDLGVGTGGP